MSGPEGCHLTAMIRVCLLVVLLALPARAGSSVSRLHEQLQLAENAEDRHAQIEILRRLIESGDGAPGSRERLIRLWIEAGDFTEALAAADAWPQTPAALRAIVEASALAFRDQNSGAALEVLQTARKRDPTNEELLLLELRCLQTNGDFSKIIESLSAFPETPHRADLLLARAEAGKQAGAFMNALADFRAAESLDTESTAASQPAFDRIEAAANEIQELEKQLSRDPDDFAPRIARARIRHDLGASRTLVSEDLEVARKIAPDAASVKLIDACLNRNAARLLVDPARPLPPAASFQRIASADASLAKNPTDGPALLERASELQAAPAQFRLALQDADSVLRIDPSSSAAQLCRIRSLAALGHVQSAASAVAALEKMNPTAAQRAEAFQVLGEAELESNQLAAALASADRGIEARPAPALHRLRAAVLTRLGRTAEAKAAEAAARKTESR